MASMKISQPVMLRKRPIDDDDDDYEPGEIRELKMMVLNYPPPKISTRVEVVCDVPPGCGIDVGSKLGKMTSQEDKDKSVASWPFENNKFKVCKPNGLVGNKPFGSRPAGKASELTMASMKKISQFIPRKRPLDDDDGGGGDDDELEPGEIRVDDDDDGGGDDDELEPGEIRVDDGDDELEPGEIRVDDDDDDGGGGGDDDDDELEPGEIRESRTMVSYYPPPKIRTGVQVVRDFPPSCEIIDNKGERKPLKNLDNIGERPADFHPGCEIVDNNAESKPLKNAGSRATDFPPGCVIVDSKAEMKPLKNVGSRPADFRPAGCGIIDNKDERKPLKDLCNGGSKPGKMTSNDKDKSVASSKPNGLVGNKPFGSRPAAGKVKFWDPTLSKEGDGQNSEVVITGVLTKEHTRLEKIKEVMKMFDEVHKQLLSENIWKPKEEKIANWRIPRETANIVKRKMKWMDSDKILGSVCGVQVGDRFRFRPQLQMVGLHCQPHSGIDYTMIQGKNLAISIVDSDRYLNKRESCDVLLYSGQGGAGAGASFLSGKSAAPEDQKLERGNLALKNSKDEKTTVRVIRRLKWGGKNSEVFVYDGLYIVKTWAYQKGAEGKMVFMFELHRIAGQPQLHKMQNANSY